MRQVPRATQTPFVVPIYLYLCNPWGIVAFYDYNDASAVSGDQPNWQAYLIRPAYLTWLGSQSTHWWATCRYDTNELHANIPGKSQHTYPTEPIRYMPPVRIYEHPGTRMF